MLLLVMFAIAAYGGEQSDKISLPRKSTSGLEGWTHSDTRHSQGAWMNSPHFVKAINDKILKFGAKYAFIVGWDFCDDDSYVVISPRTHMDLFSGNSTIFQVVSCSIAFFEAKQMFFLNGCTSCTNGKHKAARACPLKRWPLGSFDEYHFNVPPLRHSACCQKSRPSALPPILCDPPASQRYLTADVGKQINDLYLSTLRE